MPYFHASTLIIALNIMYNCKHYLAMREKICYYMRDNKEICNINSNDGRLANVIK